MTIDGHPVNLVPLPGLEADRWDDAGIGGGENAGPGSGEDAGAGIGDDAGAGGGRTDPPGPPGPPGSEAAGAADGGWRSRLADILEFARRQLDGETEVDQFGFDPEFNSRVLMPAARVLYQHWFGVRMRGLAHVPEAGPALVVANHSGTLPVRRGHASGRAAR